MRQLRIAPRPNTLTRDRSVARILVAESDENVRREIIADLVARGYHVEEAQGGAAAIERIGTENFAVLLCDRWSGGENVFEIVPRALGIDPDLAIVMFSHVHDARSAAEILSSGAYDCVSKPAASQVVGNAVERALRRRRSALERRHVERTLRESVILRAVQVEKEKEVLRNVSLEMVHSLVTVLESKDPSLRGHSARVSALAGRIAEQLNLDSGMIESIRLAGKLHDIGMAGIPDSILCKTGPLTADEFAVVRSHVEIGMTLLAPVSFIGAALTCVRDHHEHFDGTGYPRRLAGAGISLGGRIVAAADAYDALISARPFRAAHSPARALELLGRTAGKHLDPDVYRALARVAGHASSFTLI